MKILVTGAAGFVGSHTIERLLAEGHTVIGIDNLRTGRVENLQNALESPQFRFFHQDASEPSILDRLTGLERPDCIVHLAALVSVQEGLCDPDLNFALNIRLTHCIAEAMRRNKIKHLVFSSSAAVYGNPSKLPIMEEARPEPLSPYGSAKLASEDMLLGHARAYGFSAICLRYFNIYGSRQDPTSPYSGVISIFARRSLMGEPATIYGDGCQTRDFVHVSDVAKANARAVASASIGPSVFNICTGVSTSLNQLLAIIRAKIPFTPTPKYASARNGEIVHSGGDPRKAAKLLGFTANKTVEDSLPMLVDELSRPHCISLSSLGTSGASDDRGPIAPLCR